MFAFCMFIIKPIKVVSFFYYNYYINWKLVILSSFPFNGEKWSTKKSFEFQDKKKSHLNKLLPSITWNYVDLGCVSDGIGVYNTLSAFPTLEFSWICLNFLEIVLSSEIYFQRMSTLHGTQFTLSGFLEHLWWKYFQFKRKRPTFL